MSAPSSSSSVVMPVLDRNHHALAVVEDGRTEVAPGTRHGVSVLRGVAEDDVDLSGLDGGGALVGGQSTPGDSGRVAEDSGGHGATVVARPCRRYSLVSGLRTLMPGRRSVDQADHAAALLDGCQGATVLGGDSRRAEDEGSDDEPGYEFLQDRSSFGYPCAHEGHSGPIAIEAQRTRTAPRSRRRRIPILTNASSPSEGSRARSEHRCDRTATTMVRGGTAVRTVGRQTRR